MENYMSYLCFADDVVLIAACANQLSEMMAGLTAVASAKGLKVNSGKTKILTNESELHSRRLPRHITVGIEKYDVLDYDASTNYLGRKVCFKDPQEIEFSSRVAMAWGPSVSTNKS